MRFADVIRDFYLANNWKGIRLFGGFLGFRQTENK